MFDFITIPFAWLLNFLYDFTSNYGWAVILFAVIVRLILLPFQMKSKKSTMRMTRLTPKMKELEKKYSGNKQKYQEEVQKLYKSENVKPMSGCLWSLIPFPILIALYAVIRQPLTKMLSFTSEQVTTIGETISSLGITMEKVSDAYKELPIANVIFENFDKLKAALPEIFENMTKSDLISFDFLGLNLSKFPKDYFLGIFNGSNTESVWIIIAMIAIPVLSGIASYFSMIVSQKIMGNQQQQEGQPNMKMMNFMMPLVSLYIAFVMPASLGIYWIVGSILTIIQEFVLTTYYKKKLDEEDAVKNAEAAAIEAEREKKRDETAKLKAENATKVNPNTSKDKLQKQEKQKVMEKVNAYNKSVEDSEDASREGDRPFAHGRAYKPERFNSEVDTSVENSDAPADETPTENE